MVKHALEHGLEFRKAFWRQIAARLHPPRDDPLTIGGQRADTSGDAIRDGKRRFGAQQSAGLNFVGLQLVEGAVERRVLVAGVLTVR